MLHPVRTEEVIPEVFLPPKATREDLLGGSWQVWGEGLCILCCFLTPWELVPGFVCAFEVCTGSLGYESLIARWIPKPWEHGPNHGPRAVQNAGHCVQKVGQEGRTCTGPVARKPMVWPRREMGKDIATLLSFRITLASCICLTSKVPGHDPVW